MGVTFAHQRSNRWIARVAAIPIGLTIDLNGLEHGRQARGRQKHIGRDLGVAKDTPTPGSHIRCRNEELYGCAAEALEVDALGKYAAQRIEAERIEIIG